MVQTSEKEKDVRIVIVSSVANNFCKDFYLDDLNFTRYRTKGTLWSAIKIYGASKICNILFTIELANKLKNHGTKQTFKYLFYRMTKKGYVIFLMLSMERFRHQY